MKAAFKYLLVMLSMMAMTIGFAGCSNNDDDDKSSSIVGTWVLEEEYDDGYYYEEITFKSNGTVIIEWDEDGRDIGTARGSYEIDGDELILFIDDSDEYDDYYGIYIIVSITSNRLILEDEYGDRMIYYRR